ncbi:TonB-dependent receptor [Alteriqipengyuania lutimaris]|uniref:TonB-dependent receptor n=1 Tax=Alteriqipengyuania lutimaris TaxID=1538146 RepID=A0A395LNV0_9SPHN|nr:TonB-dependent receptor [Alteriqipengyuania lutimaris]MBB3032528.1 outer membrane receptor protein involved in Fe transport [Alteriqipengyuania lutimaris]RDS78339.1 TonB-dependent receptor [Alteriqipengyuania lutimaris]
MKATFTRSIALGALAGGLAFPQVAMAQDEDTEPQSAVGDLEDQLDGQTTIVVTAQGRTQQLTDVPVAVNVVSAEELRNSGASDIRELNQVAPSLLVSSTGNEANGSARIRGIGTVGDNPGLESSVAVFVDGVYRSRSGNALSELGPIDRVEVLRGPQGTLGGRNSSAGLINIYTAPPEFDFGGYGAFTYGNYDAIKVEGGLTGPIGDTLAARVDGVYFKRDGFYNDVVNDVDVNDRDRYLVRGQLLFEPNDGLSVRLTGDYSKKDEACCAATFVQPSFAPLARLADDVPVLSADAKFDYPGSATPALTSTANPIIPVLLALGQNPNALNQDTFNRDIYVSPGRSYAGETEDYGVALEANWDLGGAELTSITGYREYANFQGSDTDYTQVDILYRAPGPNAGAREFKTFSQELRLQGEAFEGKLDWLIGGYFANEKLETRDNLRFGTQYGAFAPCRVVNAINPALANPAASGCISAGARGLVAPLLGPASPLIFAGLDNLAGLNDLGSTNDVYNQESNNFAVFTHNIFNITDRLNLTLGLRYTNETKDFDAALGNDNTVCPTNRALLSPLLGTGAAALAGGIISLSCQGNSTAELDGVTLSDSRDEEEFTGTAVLSFKPTDRLLTYASYSRGYKAGGFNLDRSALQASPVVGNPALTGSTANLQFDQETVDAFEIGTKYDGRDWTLSLAGFYQRFSNFQLNTFNGSVFVVQNVNSCGTSLGGADLDNDITTGACSPDDVQPGVTAKGVEAELSVRPARFFTTNFGLTYADTRYEDDLIGDESGTPLDPALRLLPGDNLSNAPEITATASVSYTPPIGNSGLSALFYLNTRMSGDYNTGSDLLYGKEQDGFFLVNGRVGLRGPDEAWAIEVWAQNLFDQEYTQVAFNTPFVAEQQTYSAYLAEPRTYGVTVRAGF